jgi:hypothetical protein
LLCLKRGDGEFVVTAATLPADGNVGFEEDAAL